MTPAERSTLEACPTTRLHFVPNCGHMLLNQKPDWVAELIVDTVATAPRSVPDISRVDGWLEQTREASSSTP